MNESISNSILKTLAFHEAWGYAPTLPELFCTFNFSYKPNRSIILEQLEKLENQGIIRMLEGRVSFSDKLEELLKIIRERDLWQSGKRRRARFIVRYLSFFSSIRFVALANTTALGNARKDADLDFFIIVKHGSLWSTRFFVVSPLKILGLLPQSKHERDTACLSYFITDQTLDLSGHMLKEDDPYFRHWFLSLVPLYDDGVSKDFWKANEKIRARHLLAEEWIAPPDFKIEKLFFQLPSLSLVEKVTKAFQLKWFPSIIKEQMNKNTNVLVTDNVLKFHVNDNREEYKKKVSRDMFSEKYFRIIFDVLWRLTILALPWQTRWVKTAALGGWGWEQGSLAIYVSWFLILTIVILGFWQKRKIIEPFLMLKISGVLIVFIALSIIGTGFETGAMIASAEWWLQIILLMLLAITLYQARVEFRSLAFWFVLSIIPHAFLGLWQYREQMVVGSKWLGMASQLPEDLGVSVIEHGLFRVLRIYGGFPHPNIFGGWAAVGLIVSLWLAATAETKWRALGYVLSSCIASITVLLSYGRGAWLAAIVGILCLGINRIIFMIRAHRWSDDYEMAGFQYFLIALSSVLLVVAAVSFTQADHLLTRFNPTERLESKSIETRISSLHQGVDVFRQNPWFGTGPNAELFFMAQGKNELPAPLEPPHNFFFLVILNFGVVGMVMILFIFFHARSFIKNLFFTRQIFWPIFLGFIILTMFDHYPWSYWSGQTLLSISFLLIILDRNKNNV